MVNLIGKNKITAYIEQHPETKTMLLVWLKEFGLREGLSIARQIERGPSAAVSSATSPLSNGDYHIAYSTNFKLRTTFIEWVRSKEELEANIQAEFEKTLVFCPKARLEKKVITVVLTPPDFRHPVEIFTASVNVDANTTSANKTILSSADMPYTKYNIDFKTMSEYETALNNVSSIFDAEPGSSAFDYLAALVPSLKYYEDTKLAIPELDMIQVVKLKIEEWGGAMIMPHLTTIIGSEVDVELFLTGKKTLPDVTLGKIYKMLGIEF